MWVVGWEAQNSQILVTPPRTPNHHHQSYPEPPTSAHTTTSRQQRNNWMSSEMTTQPTITPAAGLLLGLITVSVGLYLYYRPPASQSSAAIAKTFDNYSDRPKTPPHTTSSSDSSSSNTNKTTKTTIDAPAEEKYPCGPMRVYFGSQTGTAEEFAQTLVEEGKARGFDAAVVDLEDFQEEDFTSAPLNKALHMFAVATYGEGEPTDNAIDFFKWLKKDVDELPSTLKFCVFGLGNTQYDHFNAMGRKINQILEEKGAVRVADYGEGDDDGTMDEDFETWRDQLWPQLATAFGGTVSQKKDGEPPDWSPVYKVTWMEEGANAEKLKRLSKSARNKVISKVNKGIAANDPDTKIALSSQSYFAAKEVRVVSNVELRKDGGTFDGSVDADGNFGSTIQVEFDLNGSDLTYNTADTLAICPENDPEIVEMLCAWQEWDADRYFLHQHKSSAGQRAVYYKPLFPSPINVRDALLRYCDLSAQVRKTVLPKLALYVQGSKDAKKKLMYYASSEGRESFTEDIAAPGKNIVDMFEMFPKLKIPFGDFLELVPRLMSRDYTISSSAVVNPNICSITCKVLRDPKPKGKHHCGPVKMMNGVCSNYLLREGSMCRAFVRESTFKLPEDIALPIIMVGPGTGIAPMRAFLQEIKWRRDTYGANKVGECDLYFGCRRPNEDYIYEEELLSYARDGALTRLEVAFSRDGPKKTYVQHLMLESKERLWKLISEHGAHVYICGGTNMGKQVRETFEKIISEVGNMNNDESMKYLKQLQDVRPQRYTQELWS